jgi:8-oxo-dGTP diphosphatase
MPNASVAAIITRIHNNDLQVLLTRRNIPPFKNFWCLPGGHVDQFEETEAAVRREVKEETGLDFQARFFSMFDELFPDIDFHNVVTVFEGSASGQLKAQESEVAEIKWLSIWEANCLELAFSHNKILKDYINAIQSEQYKNQVLNEYRALRDEILKRTELRTQVLTFTLIIAGTFFSIGAQKLVEPVVLLIYPILATFLAAIWAQLDNRIGEIGEYIRNTIELKVPGIGWENFIRTEYSKSKYLTQRKLASVSAGGIFIFTQLLSIVIAFYMKLSFSPIEIILFAINVFLISLTIFLISLRRKYYKLK